MPIVKTHIIDLAPMSAKITSTVVPKAFLGPNNISKSMNSSQNYRLKNLQNWTRNLQARWNVVYRTSEACEEKSYMIA